MRYDSKEYKEWQAWKKENIWRDIIVTPIEILLYSIGVIFALYITTPQHLPMYPYDAMTDEVETKETKKSPYEHIIGKEEDTKG